MNDPPTASPKIEHKPTFMEELPTLAAAVAVALLIRTFLFQTFYVPSDSMFPTLLVGDHVFVNKFIFGARIPFTEIQLPGFRDPERGEVVVFDLARGADGRIFPADQGNGVRTDAFVKRLVIVFSFVLALLEVAVALWIIRFARRQQKAITSISTELGLSVDETIGETVKIACICVSALVALLVIWGVYFAVEM